MHKVYDFSLNPSCLEEQSAILTVEPSFQFQDYLNFKINREVDGMFPVEIIWGTNKYIVETGIVTSQMGNGQLVGHREAKHGGESGGGYIECNT